MNYRTFMVQIEILKMFGNVSSLSYNLLGNLKKFKLYLLMRSDALKLPYLFSLRHQHDLA